MGEGQATNQSLLKAFEAPNILIYSCSLYFFCVFEVYSARLEINKKHLINLSLTKCQKTVKNVYAKFSKPKETSSNVFFCTTKYRNGVVISKCWREC